MQNKKKVLVLNGQYAPGYKGGGPIQSCINMVENLSDYFEFQVLCADRDYKEEKPYSMVKIDEWNNVGNAKVFYASPEMQTLKGFREIINKSDADIVYLNGFFSPIFTIRPLLLRRFGLLNKKKFILTPRGDFTGGCENKKIKKYGYIYASKLIGLYSHLLWHATSDIEEKDIKKMFSTAETFTVPNLPAAFTKKESQNEKTSGELKLVFVSRIFPKKNLKFALEILKQIDEGKIVFDIYGPMEDVEYWNECESIIAQMPQNVKVNYCGEVPHNEIPHIFEKYHAFFFPTLGENYGHVIVEAMMNNCICILSKGVTPWDDYIDMLDVGANLNDRDKFVSIVKRLMYLNQSELSSYVDRNVEYIEKKTSPEKDVVKYRKMLEEI